jgi:hypothetical protein
MSYTINGGVGQRDYGDLEWRLNQMQQDMKFMWSRLTDLEVARDEKVEPYDVMDSFRATKKDAGEPANQYFVDCLKENAKLVEENDVLRYQYEAMKNETMRCKEQIEQLREALHRISLGSQNSGTTKEDLGAEARRSLKESE